MNKTILDDSETQIKIKISSLEKQNRELTDYLNHIRHYRTSLERKLHGFTTPFSLIYQSWRLYKVLKDLQTRSERKREEEFMWQEIKAFNKKRSIDSLDIFNFGVIPYNFRRLRQQHLAEELAKKDNRIFYIESEFYPIKKTKDYGQFKIKKYSKNVYLVSLSVEKNIFIYSQKPTPKQIASISASFDNLRKAIGPNMSIAKIDYPFWGYFMDKLEMPVIYDCMDDYAGFEQTESHILEMEREILRKSDLVLVCSNLLRQKLKKYLPKNTILIKNGGEFDHFAKAAQKNLSHAQELARIKKPILGYFGAIGEFIDVKLIKELAENFPHCSIILIGELRNKEVIDLPKMYKNIYTLGEKPYSKLPSFLQDFDVCLIPFVVSKSTQLIDPVKLYEYLSAGKPVVTSDIKEIYEFKDVCYISKNDNEFIKNIKTALSEKNKTLINKRQQVAKLNTWKERGNVLNSAIAALVKHK